MRVFVLAFLALMAMSAPCHAQDDDDRQYGLEKLLDTRTPEQERQRIFDHYKAQALAGKTFSQYVVGSLFRVGKQLPANVVDRDFDQAKRYLSTAAAHGQLNAMAKMAEIELEEGRAMDAMIWAQVYGHYIIDSEKTPEKDRDPSAYLADLIVRVRQKFDDKQEAEMEQHLNAFVAAHDADIRAGMHDSEAASERSNLRKRIGNMHYQSDAGRLSNRKSDVLAEYIVAFKPDGSADNAWLLDALPNFLVGKELRTVAMRMKVDETDGTELRYAFAPIKYTFRQYKIVKPK